MNTRNAFKLLALAAALASASPARATLLEPDKVLLGTITLNGKAVTADNGFTNFNVSQYVVEVRTNAGGAPIATYAMGANTNYHPYFYGFRIRLEAQPQRLESELLLDDQLFIALKNNGSVVTQTTLAVSERSLSRLDFGPAADSDGDGLPDLEEFDIHHTNPNLVDTDGDLVSDRDEVKLYGTDPLDADTDNDGDSDGYELANRTDPLDPNHFLASISGAVGYGGAQTGVVRVTAAAMVASNRYLHLPGTNAYVAVDGLFYNTPGQVSELTVMSWIRTTSTAYNIIASWDRSAAWRFSVGSERLGGFAGAVGFDTTDEFGNAHDLRGNILVNDGRWHHIAASYDPATGIKRVFVDGVLDQAATNAHPPGARLVGGSEIGIRYGFIGVGSDATNFNGTTIGKYYFQGDLDEVRLWNRGMIASEVRSNMYDAVTGAESGLQAWFNFDDGTPNDDSTNAYPAIFVNGATTREGPYGYRRTVAAANSGAYTVDVLRTLSDYWVSAYLDGNANATQDFWEATGEYPSNSIFLTNDVTGVNFALADPDSDSDGLADYLELFTYGTNPFLADTDGDGLTDWQEVVTYGTNPNAVDSDGDGLNDGDEVNTHGTNPALFDTDSDGYSDGWEVREGTDPNSPADEPAPAVVNDYDGEGVSELAAYQPSTGKWYVRRLGAGPALVFGLSWGGPGMTPVVGDYSGDGIADAAVYHASAGRWYIRNIAASNTIAWNYAWGTSDMIPVAGDYDGDTRYDLALFQPSTGKWYIRRVSGGPAIAFGTNWGGPGMVPVPGDYDGDGVWDLALFHPSTGKWYIRRVDGSVIRFGFTWGTSAMTPVPGDFNGDGVWDLALYHQAAGKWYIVSGQTGGVIGSGVVWGGTGMVATTGDYNGDGAYDLAVYVEASGLWYIRSLSSGPPIAFGSNWGGSTMEPVGVRR